MAFEIIAEKINGTRKSVQAAVVGRDQEFIEDLARRQAEAGATWIDVNAGTSPEREPDDLVWLVQTVQAVVDLPLSLDTANPKALRAALGAVSRTPLVNSISGEQHRIDGVLPLAAAAGGEVVALALDDNGIPATTEARMTVIRRLIGLTRDAGIADGKVYVDPLVMTISTNVQSANIAIATMRAIKAEFPEVHMTQGLSNVSFGLPVRSLINRTYLTLAVEAGLDCAILDPNDRELRASLLATELLLGKDRHCLGYTRAYRAGRIGPVAAANAEPPAVPATAPAK